MWTWLHETPTCRNSLLKATTLWCNRNFFRSTGYLSLYGSRLEVDANNMSKWAKRVFWSATPAVLALFALAPFVHAQDESAVDSRTRAFKGLLHGSNARFGQNANGSFGRGFARRFIKQPGAAGKFSGKSTAQLEQMDVDGTSRRYYLYKPDSARLPAPLVLAFHGGGGDAEGTDKCAGGMAKLADEKGFIVVYPDAIDKHWNDGRPDLAKTNYDDVGFIAKLLDQLNSRNLIDPKRVYTTGISNGGFFSQYLAIQLPNRIAAVATVAASVSKSFLDLKVTPVPIMMLLGTKDTLVPWNGGKVGGKILRKGRGEVIPGRQAL